MRMTTKAAGVHELGPWAIGMLDALIQKYGRIRLVVELDLAARSLSEMLENSPPDDDTAAHARDGIEILTGLARTFEADEQSSAYNLADLAGANPDIVGDQTPEYFLKAMRNAKPCEGQTPCPSAVTAPDETDDTTTRK